MASFIIHWLSCGVLPHDSFLGALHFISLILHVMFHKTVHCQKTDCMLLVAPLFRDLLLKRKRRFSYLRDFNFEHCPIIRLKVL